MATFLELCVETASDSGTFPEGVPLAVTGNTGRQAKLVRWVNEAWRMIQTDRPDWRFMVREAELTATSGIRAFTKTALAASDEALFETWYFDERTGMQDITGYRVSVGVADEQPLYFIPYKDFRRLYLRGTPQTGRPNRFTINTQDELVLNPVPDEDYTLNIFYRRQAQEMTDPDDTPIIASSYHRVIKWRALLLLAQHDEAVIQRDLWADEYQRLYNALLDQNLPQLRFGKPLA